MLACVEHDDWVLCQITSNPYSDSTAIEMGDADYISGGLLRTSYVRPGTLFTVNAVIIERVVAVLRPEKLANVIDAVIHVLRQSQQG